MNALSRNPPSALLFICALCACLQGACSPGASPLSLFFFVETSEPPLEVAADPEAAFFDESLLLAGAEDLAQEDQLPCPGASAEEQAAERHPMVLRGVVAAPAGRLAQRPRTPGWSEWLVPSAHAAPLQGESGVSGVQVRLEALQPHGEPRVLQQTTTSPMGRFCLRIPEGVSPGPHLVLLASSPSGRLRRHLFQTSKVDLHALTEATARLLEERGVAAHGVPPASGLNLEVLVSTATDLLAPVQLGEGEDLEGVVVRLVGVLGADGRVRDWLDRQAGGRELPVKGAR